MNYKIDRIYEVYWVDSSTLSGNGPWYNRDNKYFKLMQCKTVGYCIRSTAEYVTLCSSIQDHDISGDMTIPLVAITKTWEIV